VTTIPPKIWRYNIAASHSVRSRLLKQLERLLELPSLAMVKLLMLLFDAPAILHSRPASRPKNVVINVWPTRRDPLCSSHIVNTIKDAYVTSQRLQVTGNGILAALDMPLCEE